MIYVIIRACGHGEWIPTIKVTDTGKLLYYGVRLPSYEAASLRAKVVWTDSLTDGIVKFKERHGL